MILHLDEYAVYHNSIKVLRVAIKVSAITSVNLTPHDRNFEENSNLFDINIESNRDTYTIKEATEELYNEIVEMLNEENDSNSEANSMFDSDMMSKMMQDPNILKMFDGLGDIGESPETLESVLDLNIASVDEIFEYFNNTLIVSNKEIQDKFVEHYSQLMNIIDFSTFIDDQTEHYYIVAQDGSKLVFTNVGSAAENITVGDEIVDLQFLNGKFIK
jgi:hypothetical protein